MVIRKKHEVRVGSGERECNDDTTGGGEEGRSVMT